MMQLHRLLMSVLASILLLSSTLAFACGVERQSVKVGTDADIGKVNFNAPQNTTIANLRAFPTPATIPANNRISPEETTVWIVNATLTEIKLESDQDYHLVIVDAAGNTMIAEIPAPTCVPTSSPMNPGVTAARATVDSMLNVTTSFQTVNMPVRLTGVGMHDFPHGQTGAAPNQIELHSVINIVFNPTAATPDFTLSASPTSLSVTQGSSASTTLSTSAVGGFNSAISLSVSGLPTGVTASFSSTSIGAPGTGSSSLKFAATSAAAAGTTNVTVTASGGGVSHATTIPITVVAAATPTFSLSASPTSLSVTQGASGSSTLATTVSGGFNSAISLAVSGLPTGVTASFSSTSIAAPGSGSSSLTFTASGTATTGTSNVTVTATGGGITHTATVSLTVTSTATPSFSLSASPTSLSVTQGASGSSTIATSVSGGFNSAISLTASGLPAGVTGSFSTTTIGAPGTGSSTLTFTASSTATSGTANVTVTATGAGITHTATIALTIRAAGGGATQLIGNPGFENGKANPAPWALTTTHSSNVIIANSAQEPPHSGTFDAWLDGFGAATTDSLLQQVTIPSTATAASLSFWLHIDTAETSTTTAFDTLQVQIRDVNGNVLQTLQTFSNLDHITGYLQHTYDVSAFIGQTIQVFLIGQEDFELQTSFVVDDFALNVQ